MTPEGKVCSMCDEAAVVVINDAPFCGEHIDDGFRVISRALCVLKGIPEGDIDHAEEMMVDMLQQARKNLPQ